MKPVFSGAAATVTMTLSVIQRYTFLLVYGYKFGVAGANQTSFLVPTSGLGTDPLIFSQVALKGDPDTTGMEWFYPLRVYYSYNTIYFKSYFNYDGNYDFIVTKIYGLR